LAITGKNVEKEYLAGVCENITQHTNMQINCCCHSAKELAVEELATGEEEEEGEEEGEEDDDCPGEVCYLWQIETRQEQARIICECVVVVWALLYILKEKDEIMSEKPMLII